MAKAKRAAKATRATGTKKVKKVKKAKKAKKAKKVTKSAKKARVAKATKTVRKKAAPRSKAASPRKRTGSRRNSAGSNGTQSLIESLALRLDEHRSEILHLYRHDLGVGLDAWSDGDDEIDRANFDSDRDLALSLSDGEREILLQIEEARRRIQTGVFGSCTSCSKPIGELRLQAIPWARYCIDCQELEEKGLL